MDTKKDNFARFFIIFYGTLLSTLFFLSITIYKGDEVLFINGNYTLFQDWFFALFTNLGDGLILGAFILFALFIRFYYAIALFVIAIGHGFMVSLFKRIILPGEGRPITLLDKNLLHFVPGINVHSQHSFPSGHTASIFALVVFLSLISRNRTFTITLTLIALLVGYSRIYLLQHFLMDVTAGAFIGAFTSYMVYLYLSSNKIPSWMNGHIAIQVKLPNKKEAMGR